MNKPGLLTNVELEYRIGDRYIFPRQLFRRILIRRREICSYNWEWHRVCLECFTNSGMIK